MSLNKAALSYLQKGLSVIVTDTNKRSLYQWKRYQSEQITEPDLSQHLSHSKAAGIAIVCGAVSGGLEVVDVDLKNDITGTLWQHLTARIEEAGLMPLLKIAKTKSNGYHIYYRCEVIEGNQKLAMRRATEQELRTNPQLKQVVVIETRGEAGYVIAAPTDGYKWEGGTLQVLTIDEREALLSICRSFNEVIEEQRIIHKVDVKEYGVSPFDDYNSRGDVVALLTKHGWQVVRETSDKVIFKRPGNTDSKSSGDYNRTLNLFSVFTTNSCFEPLKGYKPAAVFAVLECAGDFKQAARRLMEDGYGKRPNPQNKDLSWKVYEQLKEGTDMASVIVAETRCSIDEAKEKATEYIEENGPFRSDFWEVKKTKSGKMIEINRIRFIRTLQDAGFGRYYVNPNQYELVRVHNKLIEQCTVANIKDFLKEYISQLPEKFDNGTTQDELLEVFLRGSGTYFQDSFFEFLDPIEPDFLRSTEAVQYFPFRNGVVVIDRTGVTLKSYGTVDKVVWKNRVVDYDITVLDDMDADRCEYAKFLNLICGGEDDRFKYAIRLIGYLLHTYKDPAKPWAVILAEETDNDKDGGGTGKGIFVKALSCLLRTVKLDGKNFDIGKNFALQRVGLDTQLISIEDCAKNLDFEKFNSQITEGTTIEKKNKDELYIDYKDSPKFIFSTNYMINLRGNHGKRRSRVFEFAPYFKPTHTPLDEFGHLLFESWDEDEWNRFYNFLFFCCSIYLMVGMMEPPMTSKLKSKQIKVNFGEEFLDYFDNYIKDHLGQWQQFGQEYTAFLNQNDFDKKDYSNKRFKKALQESSEVYGLAYESRRNHLNGNQVEFKVG
ncbi:DNA primase/polymerase, bifunctional, N-terminal [uncultured Caudovirales phage]|uniref:DNA primase/polymerase, bifunctional, N-terminal n=1 Tax=uncultured Caudovirales phage TaxID=2100421 RepID=A0A6J5M544_9CAUD|nr:DNA primase/polymerase, bifunctional, N-terminal [uncultured Caudovirales phage]